MTDQAFTDLEGIQRFYSNGNLHRADGPAVIYPNGSQLWYQDNRLHRVDGPAVIKAGCQEWYLYGKLHRLDGPAFTESTGYQAWYQNGERHRIDGPAVILPSDFEMWYYNGTIHRDGFLPAIDVTYVKGGRNYTLERLQSAGHVIRRTIVRAHTKRTIVRHIISDVICPDLVLFVI